MKITAIHVKYTLSVESVDLLEEHAWEFDCLCISHEPPHQDAWPAEISNLPSVGESIVRISFTDRAQAENFCTHIQNSLGLHGTIEEEEVDDWLEYHKPFAQPIALNKLTIQPIEPPALENQDLSLIYLPPGLGFGTGRHETTRSCLLLLEEVPSLENKTVIDFGCGSGILAIAALRLGAKFAQYHDHDPQALQASFHNLQAHGYTEQSESCVSYDQLKPSDLLLANILWEPLDQLCEKLVALMKPGAIGIFSGLLAEQEERFIQRYSAYLKCLSVYYEGHWIGVKMQKPV